jgi:hypothetical protein
MFESAVVHIAALLRFNDTGALRSPAHADGARSRRMRPSPVHCLRPMVEPGGYAYQASEFI